MVFLHEFHFQVDCISGWEAYPKKDFVYFFIIGLFIGSFRFLCTWLFSLFVSLSVAVALGLLLAILFTGTLHEDGLVDSFTAFSFQVS